MVSSLVRVAVGVFCSRSDLELAIDQLLTESFDRADIDVLADIDVVARRWGLATVPTEELGDVPGAPRRALVRRDDARLMTIAVFQLLFLVGAFAGGTIAVAYGGGVPVPLVAAVVVGTITGLIGVGIARARFRTFEDRIEDALATGGIVVWVRVHDREQESRAPEILRSCGADADRLHQIEIDKRLEDLPLADVQIDPLLEHPTR